MLVMAKPKKSKVDKHKHKVTGVRIPPEYQKLWRDIAEAEDRGLSKVFVRALREYAAAHGFDLPPPPAPSAEHRTRRKP